MHFPPPILAFFLTAPAIPAGEGDVVINEIMYHPPAGRDGLQYLEIFNRGTAPVDLSRWSFTGGIRFAFPENAAIDPDSYLVVCRDRTAFVRHYGAGVNALGDFQGKLRGPYRWPSSSR